MYSSRPGPKVILVGIDYFTYRSSSDKNFWLDMMPELNRRIDLEVISFNYRPTSEETQALAPRPLRVHNVKPVHVLPDLHADPATAHDPHKCHNHFKRQPRSLVEYSLSLLKISALIDRLLEGCTDAVIHFMDNFGPMMQTVRRRPSRPRLSVSAMGYYARGRYHDRYLRSSFAGLDAIIPFSQAYGDRMAAIGLDRARIRPILWGVPCVQQEAPVRSAEMADAHRALAIPPGQRVVVWTGPIQQLGEAEMALAHRVATEVRTVRPDVLFVFLLKPEAYDSRHGSLAREGIRVTATSQEEYRIYQRAADVLLAPVTNLASIVTPPLTWLEFMKRGIPVVSNRAPGVEAVIDDGISGFIGEKPTPSALTGALLAALDSDLQAVGAAAQQRVFDRYCVHRAADDYVKVWQSLSAAGR